MSFQESTRANVESLAQALFAELKTGEQASLHLSAEDQCYIRFNASKVRQATAVQQSNLTLSYQCNTRKVDITCDLTGYFQNDLNLLRSLMQRARQESRALPEDRFCVPMQNHGRSDNNYRGNLPDVSEVITELAESAQNTDCTGLFAGGPQIRAVYNSEGLAHWFATESFFLDYSLFTTNAAGENKAVKALYADRIWQQHHFLASLEANKARLTLLQNTSITLTPRRLSCLSGTGSCC